MPGLLIKTTGIEDYLDESGEAFIKALILGATSAGKTRSASFWPKPIFADCEKGRMSIADRKVPFAEINSTDEMWALLDMVARECMKPFASRKYQTLVIDTIDSFQRKVIAERLRNEHKEALSGWADWGYLDAKMTMLVERLLNLPMNIVVNLHIKEKGQGQEDEGPAQKEGKLKGDIRDQIANDFDLVGHMATFWEAVEGERTLLRGIKWAPEPTFPILKDRSGTLPPFTPVTFTEEDYTGLLAYFKTGLEGLTASEDVGTIDLPDKTAPADNTVVGGPVPAPSSEKLPRSAAKKVAAPPKKAAAAVPAKTAAAPPVAASPRAVPAATKGVEVVESGAEAVPDAAAAGGVDEPDTTTDVAASTSEHQEPEATEEEALATTAEVLGAEPVDEPAAEETPAPVSTGEPPLPCGTPGKMRDGSMNENPVPGCGQDLRVIATSEQDRDRVNIAFLSTRTYLCQACFKAHKLAS